jgi:hypothetical protein
MVRKLKKFGKQLLPYIDKPGAVLFKVLICDSDGFFADNIAFENLAATKKVFPRNRSLCQKSLCRNSSKNTENRFFLQMSYKELSQVLPMTVPKNSTAK